MKSYNSKEEEIYDHLKEIELLVHKASVYLNRNIRNPNIIKPKSKTLNVKQCISDLDSAIFFSKKYLKELKKIKY